MNYITESMGLAFQVFVGGIFWSIAIGLVGIVGSGLFFLAKTFFNQK